MNFDGLNKYKALVKELVIKDLKIKYRRSFLGYLWSLLGPLMMMAILAVIFSNIFRGNIENFPLYLICGQTMWGLFSESTTASMVSIINNAALLKKVYIPKYIFPISRVASSLVTTLFSLLAILIVMLVTKANFHIHLLLTPIPLLLLTVFCIGIGLLLSSITVYFRDITHLYGVITLGWMYASAIFYDVKDLPANIMAVLKFNPMLHYITFFRNLVVDGTLPSFSTLLACILSALLALLLGSLVFRKLQKNFVLNL